MIRMNCGWPGAVIGGMGEHRRPEPAEERRAAPARHARPEGPELPRAAGYRAQEPVSRRCRHTWGPTDHSDLPPRDTVRLPSPGSGPLHGAAPEPDPRRG